jgi:chemotaxis protein CheX
MVFDSLFNVVLVNRAAKKAASPNPSHDVVIKIDITGNVNGYVIYSFGFSMVESIAKKLMPGISEDDIKNEYRDIVGEVANMMTGNSLNVLSRSGLDISPPAVMLRDELNDENACGREVLVIDQFSPLGDLETTVAFI